MSPIEKKFVLTHIVKNVSSMKEDEYRYSNTEEHYGVPWRMDVTRMNGYIAFYLTCDFKSTDIWSISSTRELCIVAVTGKKLKRSGERVYDQKISSWGWAEFVEWDEMEKDYMIDGDVVIEAHVKITKMTGIEKKKLRNFDESMKKFSDIVLIVDDQKFYVLKLFLASQSTYFESLFLRNFKESNKSEIFLKDIDPKDFQNFLELLYGESSIDDESIDGILKLADMYDVKLAVHKCEEYLIDKSEKSLKEKLRIVKQYKLMNLKNDCLSKINNPEEICSVLTSNLEEMDQSVVRELLRKSVKLMNSGKN